MLTMSVELAHHSHSLMRRIAADGMAWSMCLYVTGINSAKTAEPIEMPFGLDGPT